MSKCLCCCNKTADSLAVMVRHKRFRATGLCGMGMLLAEQAWSAVLALYVTLVLITSASQRCPVVCCCCRWRTLALCMLPLKPPGLSLTRSRHVYLTSNHASVLHSPTHAISAQQFLPWAMFCAFDFSNRTAASSLCLCNALCA